MKTLLCEVADIKYLINYEDDFVHKKFEDYLISEDKEIENEALINISYTPEDLQRWIEFDEEKTVRYAEYCCILEKIATNLSEHGMLLMHGATIEYEGKAYIFTAPSGTGKSTHIAYWKRLLGDKVNIINGDKPEISFKEDKVFVHGAPWCGKEGWQINTSAELAGVCIIKQGSENKIEKINPGQRIEFFMGQLFIGRDNNAILNTIDLFSKMASKIPFYEMQCTISKEAVKCSYEAMVGKKWPLD